jgi:hypothetical protein
MSDNLIVVSDGPAKDDLLRAVSNPDDLHVTFNMPGEPLEAHIDAIDEEGLDGLRFSLRGRLKSANFRGAHFTGVYDSSTRTGRLRLQGSI